MDHGGAEAGIGDGKVARQPALVQEMREGNGVTFQHQVKVVAGRQAQRAIPQQPADKVQFVLIRTVARGVAQAFQGSPRGLFGVVFGVGLRRCQSCRQYTAQTASGQGW